MGAKLQAVVQVKLPSFSRSLPSAKRSEQSCSHYDVHCLEGEAIVNLSCRRGQTLPVNRYRTVANGAPRTRKSYHVQHDGVRYAEVDEEEDTRILESPDVVLPKALMELDRIPRAEVGMPVAFLRPSLDARAHSRSHRA